MNAKKDMRNDRRCGFAVITARDFDKVGAQGIIDSIKTRVGENRVYISVDIDVLDPAFAPGKSNICFFLWARTANS
jgi:agmatinase